MNLLPHNWFYRFIYIYIYTYIYISVSIYINTSFDSDVETVRIIDWLIHQKKLPEILLPLVPCAEILDYVLYWAKEVADWWTMKFDEFGWFSNGMYTNFFGTLWFQAKNGVYLCIFAYSLWCQLQCPLLCMKPAEVWASLSCLGSPNWDQLGMGQETGLDHEGRR